MTIRKTTKKKATMRISKTLPDDGKPCERANSLGWEWYCKSSLFEVHIDAFESDVPADEDSYTALWGYFAGNCWECELPCYTPQRQARALIDQFCREVYAKAKLPEGLKRKGKRRSLYHLGKHEKLLIISEATNEQHAR